MLVLGRRRCCCWYSQWYQRQLSDPFTRQAKEQDYRSRAAFKLLQVQERFWLIRRNDRVLDFGSAPGGWSQVAAGLVGAGTGSAGAGGRVLGIDLLPMQPIDGVEFIQGDFTEQLDAIRMKIQSANVIISDMSPNLTGISAIDQEAASSLNRAVLEFAAGPVLRRHGHLLVKVFRSPQLKSLLGSLEDRFERVAQYKPEASRKESAEIYLVAKGKK